MGEYVSVYVLEHRVILFFSVEHQKKCGVVIDGVGGDDKVVYVHVATANELG